MCRMYCLMELFLPRLFHSQNQRIIWKQPNSQFAALGTYISTEIVTCRDLFYISTRFLVDYCTMIVLMTKRSLIVSRSTQPRQKNRRRRITKMRLWNHVLLRRKSKKQQQQQKKKKKKQSNLYLTNPCCLFEYLHLNLPLFIKTSNETQNFFLSS